MKYKLFFTSQGKFESANTEDGRSVPYFPLNPDYSDMEDPLTVDFLAAVDAGEVDISDRPATQEPTSPDWQTLESLLRGSPAWAKVFQVMSSTVRGNAAASTLLFAITTTRNENDLVFAWQQLQAAIAEQSSLPGFTEEELTQIGTALTEAGFDRTLFGME